MPRAAEILSRYRAVSLAVLASAALHAAVFVGMPPRLEAIEGEAAASYEATLDPAAMVASAAPAAAPAARAPVRRPARAKPRAPLPPPDAIALPASEPAPEPELAAAPDILPLAPEPAPGKLALAAPGAIVPGTFPVTALPASISIDYQLTSAIADGRAAYQWDREGDNYRIRGEAEAVGFFTLFLEGRILQESRGTVTPSGLRPDRFSERRPNAGEEGLDFDWVGREVTFERGGERKVTPLADNTVDWLSMIFQMAHVPPSTQVVEMQVFTQRKMYRFQLKVLGMEEIDIPLGKVRALHLRHEEPRAEREAVDVWLGVEQHYLPVKLRFPAARNRIMVEQVATGVTTR